MSYTTPPTFTAGTVLTAANLNILGDDIVYLKGITDGVTFSGYKIDRSGAGSQSIPDATDTDVTFTTEVFDSGGWWSSGATSTVPAGAIPSGYTTVAVMFIALVRFVANGTGGRKILILKNGSEVDSVNYSAISGDTTTVTLTGFTTCVAADTFKMQVRQSSGGALNMDVARLTLVRYAAVS